MTEKKSNRRGKKAADVEIAPSTVIAADAEVITAPAAQEPAGAPIVSDEHLPVVPFAAAPVVDHSKHGRAIGDDPSMPPEDPDCGCRATADEAACAAAGCGFCHVANTAPVDERTQGLLLGKFKVERTDGSTGPGGKHERCRFYVLDVEHDAFARPALQAYAAAAAPTYPALAADLRKMIDPDGAPASPIEITPEALDTVERLQQRLALQEQAAELVRLNLLDDMQDLAGKLAAALAAGSMHAADAKANGQLAVEKGAALFEAQRELAGFKSHAADAYTEDEAAEIARRGLTPGYELHEIDEILRLPVWSYNTTAWRTRVALNAVRDLVAEALADRDRAESEKDNAAEAVDDLKEEKQELEATAKEAAAEMQKSIDYLQAEHDKAIAAEKVARDEVATLAKGIADLRAEKSKAIAELDQHWLAKFSAETKRASDLVAERDALVAERDALNVKLVPVVSGWLKVAAALRARDPARAGVLDDLANDPEVAAALAVTP